MSTFRIHWTNIYRRVQLFIFVSVECLLSLQGKCVNLNSTCLRFSATISCTSKRKGISPGIKKRSESTLQNTTCLHSKRQLVNSNSFRLYLLASISYTFRGRKSVLIYPLHLCYPLMWIYILYSFSVPCPMFQQELFLFWMLRMTMLLFFVPKR